MELSKAQLFRKADWPRVKLLLSDYQDKFITNHHGKSVDDLWTKFTSALERLSSECIPTEMVRGKSSFPWITQEIKRLIRKRDHFYRKFKTTGDQTKRSKFLCLRKIIKCKTKLGYTTYLEGLLGLDSETSTACDSKKLFSFLKNSRQDQVGSPPLKQGSKLTTEPVQKANVQNNQFQSVFPPKEPLTLSRLCTMKAQDLVDEGF